MDYSYLIVFLTSLVFPCLFYLGNRNVRIFLAQLVILPAFVTAYYLIIAFVDWALEPAVALAAVPLFHFVMSFFVNRNFVIKAKSFRPINRVIFVVGFLTALLLVTLSVTLNDSRFIVYFQPLGVVIHLAAIFINTLYHCLKEKQLVNPLKRTYMAMLFAWPILLYCSSWLSLAIETLFGSENALHFTYIFFGIVQGFGTWSMLSEATRSDKEAKARAGELERVLAERDEVIRTKTAQLEKANRELESKSAWLEESNRLLEESNRNLEGKKSELEENYNRRKNYFELLSHESKTSLNLIRDNISLLEGRIKGEQSEYRTLSYEVNRLYSFFSEMLQLEALERGNFNYDHSKVVDLPLFIMQKVQLCKTTVEIAGKRIESSTPVEEISVQIDPIALDSILNNLICNAVKYAPADSPIDILVESREKEAVIYVINDNHGGLDEHYFRRNIQPYVQEKAGSDGVGLGLSIVDSMVKQLPGAEFTMSARERVTAQIILPKTTEKSGGEPDYEMMPMEEIGERSAGKLQAEPIYDESRATVMVVEDSFGMLNNYINYFGQKYNVYCESSGRGALERLKRLPLPDLIITDNVMPGMSGLELCKTLQSNREYCAIPIIFISAKEDSESRMEALENGAVDYIDKPVKMEEVLAKVKSQLKSARLKGERIRAELLELPEVSDRLREEGLSLKERLFIQAGLKCRKRGLGTSHRAIASMLDTSESRCKGLAQRIRDKLNENLPNDKQLFDKEDLLDYFNEEGEALLKE